MTAAPTPRELEALVGEATRKAEQAYLEEASETGVFDYGEQHARIAAAALAVVREALAEPDIHMEGAGGLAIERSMFESNGETVFDAAQACFRRMLAASPLRAGS